MPRPARVGVLFAVAAALEQPVLATPNLRARLASESAALGNVAQQLLSVQSDVNRVERESLGKVFDLETLRTFFAGHQQLVAQNDALNGLVKELKAQVEPVTAQLTQLKADLTAAQAKQTVAAATIAEQQQQLEAAKAQAATQASAAKAAVDQAQAAAAHEANVAAKAQADAMQAEAKATAETAAAQTEATAAAAKAATDAAKQQAAAEKDASAASAAAAKSSAAAAKGAMTAQATADVHNANDVAEIAKLKDACGKMQGLVAENTALKAKLGAGGAAISGAASTAAEQVGTVAQAEIDRLKAENAQLQSASQAATAEVQRLQQLLSAPNPEITTLRADVATKDQAIAAAKASEESLSSQLVTQHDYGLQCHGQLAACSKEVAQLKGSAVSPCEVAKTQEMLGSEQGRSRELVTKNQALQQELTREELTNEQVKYQTGREFLKMKATIGTLETHAEAVESALTDTAKQKHAVEAEVQNLKKELLGSSTKLLEHQVGVLQQELSLTNAALEKAQFEEAKARSQAQQAASYQKAAEEQAKLNAAAAQQAAEVAKNQVIAAQTDSVQATNAANTKVAQSEVDMSKKCEDVWADRNADFSTVKEELATCKADSTTMKAQVQLLSEAAGR